METFGEFIRKAREEKQLPLRKVAAALDIDTSILSKIERNERMASLEMLPILANVLETTEKEVEIKFIRFMILKDFSKLSHLREGLMEVIKLI